MPDAKVTPSDTVAMSQPTQDAWVLETARTSMLKSP